MYKLFLKITICAILALGCSTNSTKAPEREFILTLDKGTGHPGRAFLQTNGEIEMEKLLFMINDSTISQRVDSSGQANYLVSFDGLPGRADDLPEIASILYAGSRADITFIWGGCSPIYQPMRTDYFVKETNADQFILKWRVCENVASDYEGITYHTDYSIIEVYSDYYSYDSYQVVHTIDTTFISLTDSAYLPREFYPEYISTDSSEIKINTRARITNVEGPLPDEKRYLQNRDLNILFYSKTVLSGSVIINN